MLNNAFCKLFEHTDHFVSVLRLLLLIIID